MPGCRPAPGFSWWHSVANLYVVSRTFLESLPVINIPTVFSQKCTTLGCHWQSCFLRNLIVMISNFCINFLASFWSFSIWIFYTDATFLQDTTGYISSFESLQPGLVWQPDAKSIFLSLAPLWYFGRMGDILGLNKIWASIKTWWNTLNLHPLAITSWGNLK